MSWVVGGLLRILPVGRKYRGFPGGSAVKNSPANTGTTGSIPGLGRCPEAGNRKISWKRRLMGYSPWGRKRVGYD